MRPKFFYRWAVFIANKMATWEIYMTQWTKVCVARNSIRRCDGCAFVRTSRAWELVWYTWEAAKTC